MEVKPELLKELINGSRKAQRELFDMFYKPMMRVSRIYCTNDDDAKSIVLEAFMDVYNNIEKFDGKASFKTWFNKIVVNRALNQYRKNKKIAQREPALEPLMMQESFDAGEAGADIIQKITADEILTVIQTLPETERLVFTLYVIDDYAHKDIALELGFSEPTSRWHYSNARKRLQEKLKMYNITSTSHVNA